MKLINQNTRRVENNISNHTNHMRLEFGLTCGQMRGDIYNKDDVGLRGRFTTCVASHDDPRNGVREIAAVRGYAIPSVDLWRQPERTVVLDLECCHS